MKHKFFIYVGLRNSLVYKKNYTKISKKNNKIKKILLQSCLRSKKKFVYTNLQTKKNCYSVVFVLTKIYEEFIKK